MAFCTSCGRNLLPTQRFCTGCGAAAAPVAPATKICVVCGNSLPLNIRFCTKCGTPAMPTPQAAAPIPQPVPQPVAPAPQPAAPAPQPVPQPVAPAPQPVAPAPQPVPPPVAPAPQPAAPAPQPVPPPVAPAPQPAASAPQPVPPPVAPAPKPAASAPEAKQETAAVADPQKEEATKTPVPPPQKKGKAKLIILISAIAGTLLIVAAVLFFVVFKSAANTTEEALQAAMLLANAAEEDFQYLGDSPATAEEYGAPQSTPEPTPSGRIQSVTIGNQEWMAQNLNIKVSDSYCYDDNPANCETYGRLYTWYSAQNVCPSGWVLPSKADFDRLGKTLTNRGASDKMEKSSYLRKYSWDGGMNTVGFNAEPSGTRFQGKYYGGPGTTKESAHYWTSDSFDDSQAYDFFVYIDKQGAGTYSKNSKSDRAYSVRCIKESSHDPFGWLTDHQIEEYELARYSAKDLRIFRNAIFARHGYSFKSNDLKEYFSKYTWYTPQYTNVDKMLSANEKANVTLIKSME